MDKILTICQGDVSINLDFLDYLLEYISVSSEQEQNKTDTVSLACQNLWQTIKEHYISTLNQKTQRMIIKWLQDSFQKLKEKENLKKLEQLIDISSILVQELISSPSAKLQGFSDCSSMLNFSLQGENKAFLSKKKKKMSSNNLEVFYLLKPLVSWYNFTLQSQERLPLFKKVLKALSLLIQNFPKKDLELDMISLNMEAFIRLDKYCQVSNPSSQMLIYLKTVLNEIVSHNTLQKLKLKNRMKYFEFLKFFDQFFLNFIKCIPHHLYDEVFEVTELMLQLNKERITQEQVKALVDSLIDKYTMRSKAHSQLMEFFVKTVIQQSVGLEMEQGFNRNGPSPGEEEGVGSIRRQGIDLSDNLSTNERFKPHAQIYYLTAYLLNQNQVALKTPREGIFKQSSEQEVLFEKLNLLQLLVKSLGREHIQVFKNILEDPKFRKGFLSLFKEGLYSQKFFQIFQNLSDYFTEFCAPQNIYKRQICRQDQRHLGNQQHSSQGHADRAGRNNSRSSFVSSGLGQREAAALQFNSRNPHYSMDEQPILLNQLNVEENEDLTERVEVISKERLLLIQMAAQLVRVSMEKNEKLEDSYLQFNTLNLLQDLFANLLVGPTIVNNIYKPTQNLSNLRSNEIPDIETMTICSPPQLPEQPALGSQISASSQHSGMNNYLDEVECTDLKYQHARLHYVTKIWAYLDKLITSSPWSQIKSSSYSTLCHILKLDLNDFKPQLVSKFKTLFFKILSQLFESKETETKAEALNILGSFCLLSQQLDPKLEIHEHLDQYRKHSNLVPLSIWQKVYELQSEWDQTLREPASVLIQLSAPRGSVKHFKEMNQGNFDMKISGIMLELNQVLKQNELDSPLKFQDQRQNSFDSLSPKSQDKDSENAEGEESSSGYFYTDKLDGQSLREQIQIFRHQYKPLKSLWVDKEESLNNSQQQMEEENKKFQDQFEDKIVGSFSSSSSPGSGKQDMFIFERHFEAEKKVSEENQISHEDLGIIDLDEAEGFEDPDDEKVPVLKNTFSKTNRPNNSKSLAIGSRSQGGVLKKDIKQVEQQKQEQQQIIQQQQQQQQQQEKAKVKPVKPQSAKQRKPIQQESEFQVGSQQTPSFGAKSKNSEDGKSSEKLEDINKDLKTLEHEKRIAEEKKLIEEEQKELDQEDFEEFKGSDDLEDDLQLEEPVEQKKKVLNKSFENWAHTKQPAAAIGFNSMAKKHIYELNLKKNSKDKGSVSPAARMEPVSQKDVMRQKLQTQSFSGAKLGNSKRPVQASIHLPSEGKPFPLSPTGSLSQKSFWTGPLNSQKQNKASFKSTQSLNKSKTNQSKGGGGGNSGINMQSKVNKTERSKMQTSLVSPKASQGGEVGEFSKGFGNPQARTAQGFARKMESIAKQSMARAERKSFEVQKKKPTKVKQVYVSRTKSQSHLVQQEDEQIGQEEQVQWAAQEPDFEAVVMKEKGKKVYEEQL